jgi:hypothetical protein
MPVVRRIRLSDKLNGPNVRNLRQPVRYSEYQAADSTQEMQIYSQSEGLHLMLNFTVSLALVIGFILFWLGRQGRILWLSVWSAGLMVFSAAYLAAALDLIV